MGWRGGWMDGRIVSLGLIDRHESAFATISWRVEVVNSAAKLRRMMKALDDEVQLQMGSQAQQVA